MHLHFLLFISFVYFFQHFTAENDKDDRYWEKRIKNNVAARRYWNHRMDVVKEFILCFQISRGKETEGEPDRPPRRLPRAGEHQAEARPRGVQVSQLQAYDRERHSQTENGKVRWDWDINSYLLTPTLNQSLSDSDRLTLCPGDQFKINCCLCNYFGNTFFKSRPIIFANMTERALSINFIVST